MTLSIDCMKVETDSHSVLNNPASWNKESFDPVKQIQANVKEFEQGIAATLEGTQYLKIKEDSHTKYFGIHKDEQALLDFTYAKTKILEKLCLPADTQIIQVIGDSQTYIESGTSFCKEYLNQMLDEHRHLVLWGFTGQKSKSGDRLDANQIVNQWVDASPNRTKRALANIVDFHTVKAIEGGKCDIAQTVQNFYVVYGQAKFGDDIISSDSITDLGLCLEGGVQSFCQVVNFLSLNIKVQGVFNVRGQQNSNNYDSHRQEYLQYLSAAEFIFMLNQHIQNKQLNGSKISVDDIENFKESYLKTHYLCNPNRQDVNLKKALFDVAWKKFIDEQLWLRLDNCIFHRFEG